MKRVLPIFLLHLLVHTGFCQFDFGKLKDAYKTTKETLVDNDIDLFKQTDEDHDATSYNYAIAFLDNAGLFEIKENFFKRQSLLLGAIDNELSGDAQTGDKAQDAKNMNDLGERLYAYRKFELAEDAFKKALSLYPDKNSPEYANTLNNLGLLYHTTGRITQAEDYTREALSMRKHMSKDLQAISLNNLAVILKDQGMYNEANEMLMQAIQYNQETIGNNTIQNAIALNNKAVTLHNLGRYKEAEQMMVGCLYLAKESLSEKSANYVKLKINLALIYRDMQAYEKAEQVYQEAIELKEKRLGKKHPDYAHLLKGLAALYMETKKYDEVEELLLDALDIYRKKFGEEHPSFAATAHDLGAYYRVKKQYGKSSEYLEKAMQSRATILGKSHPDYIQSVEELALLEWEKGNVVNAYQHFNTVMETTMEYKDKYFVSMSEFEKEKFWATLIPRLDKYYSFAIENRKVAPELMKKLLALRLSTKGILLNNSNRIKNVILNSGNIALIEKYNQWIDLKEELARLYTYSKEELEEENINLVQLELNVNKLERELSKESMEFSSTLSTTQNIDYETLKKQLNSDETLVEIIAYRKFHTTFSDSITYAFVIINSEQQLPDVVVMENGEKMNGSYFKYYRNATIHKSDDKKSYDRFWSPVQAALKETETVYLSLDGVYNQININTMKDESGNYVLEKENIIFLTNAKDLPEVKKRRSSSATNLKAHNVAHLYGFPTYGGDITPLPGTKAEVESINTTLKKYAFKTSVFMTDQATEKKIKTESKSAGILHIATHGFFLSDVNMASQKVFGIETSKAQQNPLHRAGLLLANASETMTGESADHSDSNNGVLTAYEVMNLNLSNTDLLVMSACETGKGDVKAGEGVYGLQRAFQVAGVKTIVMSLWKVNDEATMFLMNNFYKFLTADVNKDKETAFIKAQKALKTKYPEPYYWGAFVLLEN